MANSKKLILGEFIFDYLHKQGAKKAFGIPGDFVLPTVRFLEDSKIDFITLAHEPAVGFAADAYARINGLGVACVTYCVGGLNMLNSVAGAYAEKSPIIVISGGPSKKDKVGNSLLHHKVKSFDTQRKIYEEVTCANTILDDPATAADEIIRVIEEAKSQCRPGYIEIPFDMADIEISPPSKRKKEKPTSDKDLLNAALTEVEKRISAAKQPVIIAGVELHRHGLTDIAVEIAQKFNIPICSSLLSKSVISEQNPLYIGVYSGGLSEPACGKYVDESDCVIMLGTFITDVFLGLYTSKLERKNTILATTEETKIGFYSFDNIILEDFLNGLKSLKIKKKPSFKNPNPLKEAPKLKNSDRENEIEIEDFFNILSSHMDEGSTIISDTGDALLGAISLRTGKRSNFISDAYYLSMGFAIPASIGVCAGSKKSERVFAVVGDGAFQMTSNEISTLAKYKMKPIIIVLNNDGYGTQRHIIDGDFNKITQWNYTKICDLVGYGESHQVKTLGALDDALNQAVKADTMSLIEVIVPRDSCSTSLKRMGEELGKLRNKN